MKPASGVTVLVAFKMNSDNSASLNARTVIRGGPIRWLILGGMLLIAGIAVGATVMAGNFRERALNNAERELANTVLLLARHFDQQLEDFEVIQSDLIHFMQSNGITTPENYKRQMSSEAIHLMLKSKMSALSYVGGINVFDADGKLINASAVWPIPPVSAADRAYFRAFKSNPRSPDLIVEPVYSRITGVWTTVLARKVKGPNGEFLGYRKTPALPTCSEPLKMPALRFFPGNLSNRFSAPNMRPIGHK